MMIYFTKKLIKIKTDIDKKAYIFHVKEECLNGEPFTKMGQVYHIISFIKVRDNYWDYYLWDYECEVIKQEKWRDNQLKKILN